MLSVEDLCVHFEIAEVVKSVCFKVGEGDIVTLIGANGAGKTTILRTISGLKRPTLGTIWFRGQRIDRMPPQNIVKLGIAHVPEGRRIFPKMTVLENLKMGAYLRKDTKKVRQDLADVFCHFSRLRERENQQAGTLSGGEQQMLAMARALMWSEPLRLDTLG